MRWKKFASSLVDSAAPSQISNFVRLVGKLGLGCSDGYPFQYQHYGAPSGTGNSPAWALYENIFMKRKKRSRLITREVTTQLHINTNGTYHKLIVGVDKHLNYLLLIPNCPCPVTAVYTVSDRVNSTKSMSQLLLTRSGPVGSIHMSAKEMCFVYISPITNRIIVMYFTRYDIVRSRQMCGFFLFNKTRGHYPDDKMEETLVLHRDGSECMYASMCLCL